MGATATKADFASLLEDLLALQDGAEAAVRPTRIPFDYLSVAEELHSGRIRVSGEEAAAQYGEVVSLEAEIDHLLTATETAPSADREALPTTDPDAIALEIGLQSAGEEELARLRRRFARRNHPDLVDPHLRPIALKRMQIANSLIDEARRRALARRPR